MTRTVTFTPSFSNSGATNRAVSNSLGSTAWGRVSRMSSRTRRSGLWPDATVPNASARARVTTTMRSQPRAMMPSPFRVGLLCLTNRHGPKLGWQRVRALAVREPRAVQRLRHAHRSVDWVDHRDPDLGGD